MVEVLQMMVVADMLLLLLLMMMAMMIVTEAFYKMMMNLIQFKTLLMKIFKPKRKKEFKILKAENLRPK
jgi:hypothetical protein